MNFERDVESSVTFKEGEKVYSINISQISEKNLNMLQLSKDKHIIRSAEVCDENNVLCKYFLEYNPNNNIFTIQKCVNKKSSEILCGVGTCKEFQDLIMKDWKGINLKEDFLQSQNKIFVTKKEVDFVK